MTYVPDYLDAFYGEVKLSLGARVETAYALNQTVALAAAWCSSLEASLRFLCTEETVTITKKEYDELLKAKALVATSFPINQGAQRQYPAHVIYNHWPWMY